MALITSHTLNGVDGTHAGGINVSLMLVGNPNALVTTQMDDGGRLSFEFIPEIDDPNATYELVFNTQMYWHERGVKGADIMTEIVLRFKMTNIHGKYHMPVILSPFSYSTWKSG